MWSEPWSRGRVDEEEVQDPRFKDWGVKCYVETQCCDSRCIGFYSEDTITEFAPTRAEVAKGIAQLGGDEDAISSIASRGADDDRMLAICFLAKKMTRVCDDDTFEERTFWGQCIRWTTFTSGFTV